MQDMPNYFSSEMEWLWLWSDDLVSVSSSFFRISSVATRHEDIKTKLSCSTRHNYRNADVKKTDKIKNNYQTMNLKLNKL